MGSHGCWLTFNGPISLKDSLPGVPLKILNLALLISLNMQVWTNPHSRTTVLSIIWASWSIHIFLLVAAWPNICVATSPTSVWPCLVSTWCLMYFNIPESFFPSKLISITLFFREGVLRHDLSEHWKGKKKKIRKCSHFDFLKCGKGDHVQEEFPYTRSCQVPEVQHQALSSASNRPSISEMTSHFLLFLTLLFPIKAWRRQ